MANTLIFYYEESSGVQTGYEGYLNGKNCTVCLVGDTAPLNQTMTIDVIDLKTNEKERVVITNNEQYMFFDNKTYILVDLIDNNDGEVYLTDVRLRPNRDANAHSGVYGICGDKCRVPVLNDTGWQDAIIHAQSNVTSIVLQYRIIDSTLIIKSNLTLQYESGVYEKDIIIGTLPEEVALRLSSSIRRIIDMRMHRNLATSPVSTSYIMSAILDVSEDGLLTLSWINLLKGDGTDYPITFNFEEHYALD